MQATQVNKQLPYSQVIDIINKEDIHSRKDKCFRDKVIPATRFKDDTTISWLRQWVKNHFSLDHYLSTDPKCNTGKALLTKLRIRFDLHQNAIRKLNNEQSKKMAAETLRRNKVIWAKKRREKEKLEILRVGKKTF